MSLPKLYRCAITIKVESSDGFGWFTSRGTILIGSGQTLF